MLSYYSPPVIQIRPVMADTILPANNPKLADLKLGAVLYQDIQILRFLADNNAVGRYEGMLKFITDRGNVTRPEIEAFYRNGIRGFISDIVDEEFNKISFMIDRNYNAVLTRNAQNGHYMLSYERPSVQNSRKELSGASLEALSSAMSNSGEFTQDGMGHAKVTDTIPVKVFVIGKKVTDTCLNVYTTIHVYRYITLKNIQFQ